MNRISFLFLFVVLLISSYSFAQEHGPVTDTAKAQKLAKKPIFTLQTIRAMPLYIFEINDNAKIDASHQFPGIRPVSDSIHLDAGPHFKNIRQLTFEGVNSRPSISSDDRFVVFQAHGIKPNSCDQIYRLPLATGVPADRISNGKGRAQGAAFLSGNEIVYSSTQALFDGACPPQTSEASDLYVSDTNGKELHRLTTNSKYFNGDPMISSNGGKIIFLSDRSRGQFQFFSATPDGSGVHQLTHESGFDGGALSSDGKEIVACKNVGNARGIYIMEADGSHMRQLTRDDGEAPCFTPDGAHIVFSKTATERNRRVFDLYIMKNDGSALERLTVPGGDFEFPTFTHDGKQIIFCSKIGAAHPEDLNIFVADWMP